MKALVYPAESAEMEFTKSISTGERSCSLHISGMTKLQNIIIMTTAKLIRWIDSNGKCHDNEKDNEEYRETWREILEQFTESIEGRGNKDR